MKIPLRLYLMHLQNLQTVTVTNVNLVKLQLTGGKISKILWMISFSDQMFTSVALQFQLMRRSKRKREEEEVVLTSMEIARHVSPDRLLRRLRLILRLEHSISKKVKSGSTL